MAGYRSKNSFLAIRHLPIQPFVPQGFDLSPVAFTTSVSNLLPAPNHAYEIATGEEKHPY
ncbi:MAG TPA: hypothetical protein PKY77_25190 [Phycisphaerae bacterium]|nr:hypothetical protein [Phycisphaerae bacterium]HRY71500.1 hypothetical protein [Phycisphaerae bacterium]HSA29920.1 hypothetical protein [Phycisphaerae bacterium]